jgi:phenylacetate-CoA ligase
LGLTPEDIQSPEDLVKLPILTKQLIRDNYEDLISKTSDRSNLLEESSGGSTGTPLKFAIDKSIWGLSWAATFRSWRWYGFSLGERIFTFGGNSLVKTRKEKRRITAKDIFDRVIMRNLKCDCSDMSAEALLRIYKRMIAYRPRAIRGYPAAIYHLAKFIDEHNLSVPQVKLVLTTGEMLLPQYRNLIQRVFRAPVYDGYGAGDGGVKAFECYMHEGLHIVEEQCVVEITDNKGALKADGELGYVITTDLNNYAFPFIRYQVGDMAIMKPERCSCGRSSRLIAQIAGRSGRTLYAKSGQAFTSVIIDNMMFLNMDYHRKEHESIYQKMDKFQVRQDKDGDICILIKPKYADEPMETFQYVVDNFKKHFIGSRIELCFVKDIPPLPSGKDDYCVSEYTP